MTLMMWEKTRTITPSLRCLGTGPLEISSRYRKIVEVLYNNIIMTRQYLCKCAYVYHFF